MPRAKRRTLRSPADPGQTDRPEPPLRRVESGRATSRQSSLLYFFIGLFLPLVFLAVYRFIYSSPIKSSSDLSVYERGLVKTDTSSDEILAESSKVKENASRRHLPLPVLAYITPWNARGYEMAKKFVSKFTHISPVWYELKSEGSKLLLEGRHNADTGWMADLRMKGDPLILPRVVLEAYPGELLRKKNQWEKAIHLILKECEELSYDGIVLESWSRWAAYGILQEPDLRSMALEFIKRLGKALHSVSPKGDSGRHLELIYVIPAPHTENLGSYDFGPNDFQTLSADIDGFSLMTYDFSGPNSPGPNAPLDWIRSSLQIILHNSNNGDQSHGHKIFLGINFYGNDFVLSKGAGGGAVTGGDYLSLLKKYKPVIQWGEKFQEHYFIYSVDNAQHAVFYPSLMSITMRLDEARAWGVGLSIWEIGQGLDYFFDLL
ncbi:hypothetical protein H6P81_014461 [Aristolochia fimbriata]|uniref:Chitinase domain-containing protein 1 n=1 Tax=Aristolochia fimbriata TaxID=158543 RepID=A0AAV7EHT9_ARIFI|nr:hypothetical protein H6P81_014461 [Aristolochia fimbriata]